MGCGPSQVEPGANPDQRPLEKPKQQNGAVQNGHTPSEINKKSTIDSNANRPDEVTNNPVPRSVAFTVDLDGKETQQKLLGAPPPRLKRLDPLNVPKLTAEELAEKQRIADEKREAQIKRKQSASLKASRRRQQILDAQRYDKEIQQKEVEGKINESLSSAGKTREAKLKDIQEKQRIREERARRAREKVKKMNDLDHELDIDVEKDEDYNAEDVGDNLKTDSWLNGDNNNNDEDGQSGDSGERIYSGRSSPKKQTKEGLTRGISSRTVDSFDNAFNRKPPSASHITSNGTHGSQQDDFFDS
ncbi:uncharacterized protein LOC132720261 isoform X2 [Ruditapes philippinarum]|uniref:uncharacterized protein LOC132720261 isoform X2 n=1 Tax=Ruditapes philippinarum TaxID=129788 RepID=UPI00295B0AB4|nr:uncharacterized protein LOC132720261 isoform X2 [Ruditapes philippinarum]